MKMAVWNLPPPKPPPARLRRSKPSRWLHRFRRNSGMNIELPIQRNLFEELSIKSNSTRKSHFVINSLSDFDCILGEGWHWRVCNEERDSAHIEPGTLNIGCQRGDLWKSTQVKDSNNCCTGDTDFICNLYIVQRTVILQ